MHASIGKYLEFLHTKRNLGSATFLLRSGKGGKARHILSHADADRQGKFQRQTLVFLNACQSAGDTDDICKTFNLPNVFIERGAAAIVATICLVPDLFAAAFARVFYQFFSRGQEVTNPVTKEITFRPMAIGEAIRTTRWYFLEQHNNPLGLAYGLYTPVYYRLAQLPGGTL